MSTVKVYNWGIIGCGKCSSAFAPVLQQLYERSKLVACGARTLSKAQRFAKQFGIPQHNAYDSYDAVSNDPNVDIVYIGTIHPSHHRSVINALNNRKHVLCEKPIAINHQETEEMVQVARQNKCFLMEAMWTRFFPAWRKMRELINDGTIGSVVSFYADFGREISKSSIPRIYDHNLCGGSLLEMGCYVINPLSMLFGCKMPSKIKAIGLIDSGCNVDICCSASVVYEDTKQFAQFSCNVSVDTFEEWHIIGKKGRIKIKRPAHCPTRIVLYHNGNEEQFEFKWPTAPTKFPGKECFLYEIEAVTTCIDKRQLESPEYTWNEMITTMKIMDRIRQQIGVIYQQDRKLKSGKCLGFIRVVYLWFIQHIGVSFMIIIAISWLLFQLFWQ